MFLRSTPSTPSTPVLINNADVDAAGHRLKEQTSSPATYGMLGSLCTLGVPLLCFGTRTQCVSCAGNVTFQMYRVLQVTAIAHCTLKY